MGYNVLSGNVLLPGQLLADGQISSSAFVGDGKELQHVLKITSGPDQYNLTTIGTDAYKLTGQSNLTFNGSRLTVTGEVSASVGISSSFFIGDGRFLTNVPGTGGGTGGGIFTELANNLAATTSSIAIGGSTAPDHAIALSGAMSASLNVSASGFIGNRLSISGAVVYHHRTSTSTITASVDDYYIGMDSNSAAVELRLPDAAVLTDGHTYIVKDEGGNAGTNNITILASGSQTIDGENSLVLESPYASFSLYCNGVNKYYVY
jgi:flagellar hook assembly protein FlgD